MAGRQDKTASSRPPGEPWRAIEYATPEFGYASYYLSDDLARLPVRAVTRIKDNKSDPNLETATYGLFSTCEQKMRSGIVTSCPRYLFFITRPRNGPRQLTGMYELKWWAPGSFRHRTRDFALAASSIRFIEPVALESLPGTLGPALSGRWRLNKRLDSEQTAALTAYVMGRPDMTGAYLQEIDRVEQINVYHSAYRYPTWRRTGPFSWSDAARYLKAGVADSDLANVPNTSPSGWWRCIDCGADIENAALLKACPACHEHGTLRPLNTHEPDKEP